MLQAADAHTGAGLMTEEERKSLLTIVVFAALADGARAEQTRGAIRRLADAFGEGDLGFTAPYRDVLRERTTLAAEAAKLGSPALRQLAFELALGVCDADGLRNDAQTRFLAGLGRMLGLSQSAMAEAAATADALATVPLEPAPQADAVAASAPTDAGLDRMILDAAIDSGALDLLPQPIASIAIIALQMKMLYRIGQAYGAPPQRGTLRDFLAAVGASPTGQYLEGIGRKLIGGLSGPGAQRLAGERARSAIGDADSFATTYALGHVARRDYAGGRTTQAQTLKDAFAALRAQARALQPQYAPSIEQRARSVDVARIVAIVRSR